MMRTPVFFSRPAVMCAAGNSAAEFWHSLESGNQSGIKKTKALNGKEFYAGRIDCGAVNKKSSAKYDMRIMRIEEACLSQIESLVLAVKDRFCVGKIGVCVGSCDNGTEFSLAGHREYFKSGAFLPDYSLEIQGADYVASFISEKYGLEGPSLAFSTACSSSAGAIIKAAELLDCGICDAVVAGGIDIASDTVLMGFDSLEAVSPEITNPFSRNRRGITLAEGAAFFVMTREPLEDGQCVRLLGYGESADAYHMTSPDPTGEGARRAMEDALSSAGLKPSDIDYLNLHGTGTKFNDSMEASGVDKVFGSFRVPCSTTKALTGHTLGAAGALEAAACCLAVSNNSGVSDIKLPLQVWDGVRDPELPEINIVDKNKSENTGKVRICMSNSFAFGGANSSLIIGVK